MYLLGLVLYNYNEWVKKISSLICEVKHGYLNHKGEKFGRKL
jgi:hypothetical protein